jgi:hypothetical protein
VKENLAKFGMLPIRELEPHTYLVWNTFHEGEAVICVEPGNKTPRKWPEIVVADLSEVWRCPKAVDPLRWYRLITDTDWLVRKLDTLLGDHYHIIRGIADKVEVRVAVKPSRYDPLIREKLAEEAVREGRFSPFSADFRARTWYVQGKEVPRGVWRELVTATNADASIFVANSGISYMEAFRRETNSKVVLIEVHAEPGRRADLRGLDELRGGERVIVADRVYSGATLLKVKEILQEKNIEEAILVGLFPKSRKGILMCDYIVWNWKVLKVDDVKGLLRGSCWPEKLYELTMGRRV